MRLRQHPSIMWALVVGLAAYGALYFYVLMPVSPEGFDPAAFSRGIGTPLLRWLNGYLGPFGNLRFLSPAAVLALPAILLALWQWRQLLPWERAGITFIIFATVVVGALGGFNYRYAMTLQPLLLFLVIQAAHRVLGPARITPFLTALVVLTALNTLASVHHRQRVKQADPTHVAPDSREGALRERLDTGPQDLDRWLEQHGVARTDTVLVNNLPVWFYVTDRPGVYFWCGSDQLFLADGKPLLFQARDDEQALGYLRDSLHCRYVFSTTEYQGYSARFDAFLERHARLVAQDDRGHTLHRLADTFGR